MAPESARPQLTITTSHSNKPPRGSPVSPLSAPGMDLPTTGEPTPISPLGQSSVGKSGNVAFSWEYWTDKVDPTERELKKREICANLTNLIVLGGITEPDRLYASLKGYLSAHGLPENYWSTPTQQVKLYYFLATCFQKSIHLRGKRDSDPDVKLAYHRLNQVMDHCEARRDLKLV